MQSINQHAKSGPHLEVYRCIIKQHADLYIFVIHDSYCYYYYKLQCYCGGKIDNSTNTIDTEYYFNIYIYILSLTALLHLHFPKA